MYRKPVSKRASKKLAPPYHAERFDGHVLQSSLWYSKECGDVVEGQSSLTALQQKKQPPGKDAGLDGREKEAGKDAIEAIPLEFNSIDDYISAFDPLVLEEARESVRSTWVEQCNGGNGMAVVVMGVEELQQRKVNHGSVGNCFDNNNNNNKEGVSRSGLVSSNADAWFRVKLGVRKGSVSDLIKMCPRSMVVVLSSERPPTRGVVEWYMSGIKNESQNNEMEKIGAAECQNVESSEVATNQRQGEAGDDARLRPVLIAGICQQKNTKDGNCVIVKIHPICNRHAGLIEKCGLEEGEMVKCRCYAVLRKLCDAVHSEWWVTPAQMLVSSEREFDALHQVRKVDPDLMKYILKPKMLALMSKVYKDDTMRQKLWPEEARHKAFIKYLKSSYDYKQLEAIEMAACQLSSRQRRHQPGASVTHLPFLLIQGPPGTGKTHTVQGVLNVWHLVAFQQYYSSLMNGIIEKSRMQGSGLNSITHALTSGARKPRILVCTPSNAACDELMARVMEKGFCDGNGKTYRPNVIRIGGDTVVDDRVKERIFSKLVSRYSKMSPIEWQQSYQGTMHSLQATEREARMLEISLSKASSKNEIHKTAHLVVEKAKAISSLTKEIEKLEACRPLVDGQREGGMGSQAMSEIETSILSDAEMVFSTLSGTQRKVFKDACTKAPFHTVLIDEAGQASEVAALQPLTAGAKSVVLVGDPQQLPATILSEAARALAMERSLFERLQAQGCPVALLSVQYRMHPEIRSFPSLHFYQGKLEDAAEVKALPPEPYHSEKYLGPYHVFDVAGGKERRQKSGGSLSNVAEAEVAVGLYKTLQNSLDKQGINRKVSVAVITPYREQRTLLKETFKSVCGPSSLNKVAIETVDSYQGRQVDIVILSCVRAGSSGGLGFVNDIRRMNVAITRARRSLWILGSLATLRTNKEWEALIVDAENRGVVVSPAHAQDMFPDMDTWKAESHDTPQQRMAKDIRLITSASASRPGDKTSIHGINSRSSTMLPNHSHVPSATAARPIRPMSSLPKAPVHTKPMRSVRSTQTKRERSLSPSQEPVHQDAKKTLFPQLPTGR